MRVTTGTARGRLIETVPGEDIVRPTAGKVKEAVFSAVQFFIPGCRMLDIFAGSGQMGIEALSRGAEHCVFVDSSREAIAVIKRNLNKTDFFKNATVAETDGIQYLQHNKTAKFDFIFSDPPYRKGLGGETVIYMGAHMNDGALAAVETARDEILPEETDDVILKKRYDYGNTTVWMYRKKEAME